MRALLALAAAWCLASCIVVGGSDDDDDENGGEAGETGNGGSPSGGMAGMAGDRCLGAAGSPTVTKGCGCTRDCDVGEECGSELATGIPGGLCVGGCSSEDPCPEGLDCIELTPGDPRTRMCQPRCTTTDDCRPGYICRVWPPSVDAGDTYCLPYCTSDADCPATGRCDLYTGVCGEVPHTGTKPNGAECTDDSECISELCIYYCTSLCSMARQGCPDGLVCSVAVYEVGDLGGCEVPCSSSVDCPGDTICQASELPGVRTCY